MVERITNQTQGAQNVLLGDKYVFPYEQIRVLTAVEVLKGKCNDNREATPISGDQDGMEIVAWYIPDQTSTKEGALYYKDTMLEMTRYNLLKVGDLAYFLPTSARQAEK